MIASRNFAVLAAVSLVAGPLGAGFSHAMPSGDPATDEIARLADDSFQVREEATRKLWAMGAGITPKLREAIKSGDPEVVKRASYLLRRIDFDLAPDSPPEIIALVDKFTKAPRDQKLRVVYELRQQRAWRQILKLYAQETDMEIRNQIRAAVDGVAVNAAREALVAGKTAEAKSFLEMNPNDSQGLLPLAAFLRNQGALKAELEKGRPPAGASRAAWELALYRVSGDVAMARAAAAAAKDEEIGASCAMMDGDPLPWMELSNSGEGPVAVRELYRSLAEKRWRGETLTPQDLEAFEPYTRGGDDGSRWMAANCLFLLGQTAPAEAIFAKLSPVNAFKHFETLERLPDAYRALGLDPAQPDFPGWIAKRFKGLGQDGEEQEDRQNDLAAVAIFLERRGLTKELAAFDGPLAKLADDDADTFLHLIGLLVGGSEAGSSIESGTGAVALARRAVTGFAKEDDAKWHEALSHVFSEADQIEQWWEWLEKLDPKASRAARFDGMLALFRYGSESATVRNRWLKLAWAAIDGLPKADATEKISLMADLAATAHDLQTGLKAWDLTVADEDPDSSYLNYLQYLTAAGRWDRAAELWLKIVEKNQGRGEFHAYAAACLRRAGKNAEASVHDAWADKLALADPITCIRIGQGYAFGGDFTRAERWWEHAMLVSAPGSDFWTASMKLNAMSAMEKGDWKRAAALQEVLALSQNGYENLSSPPGLKLRLRVNADFCRALARLKTDREASIATLQQCHRLLSADGSLADYFFPALRKAGLVEQHDAWFEQTWAVLMPLVKAFPNCENTRNTAAWLASRAVRRLDEANELVDGALATSPQQAAYLDTKAEIQFARKDRKAAIEWSGKALAADPMQDDLRRQYERFRNAPFPQ
ncbi:hypothetical protein [Luteolibacter sp. LG18]|uniref:hypothetical protein n=1 Tax=Luteolibacter sp. LG18 TaxID=2819286 RepID=UPI002B28E709|nr:hypothetical protein llg_42130 [Luteolibacter sp. LG18]